MRRAQATPNWPDLRSIGHRHSPRWDEGSGKKFRPRVEGVEGDVSPGGSAGATSVVCGDIAVALQELGPTGSVITKLGLGRGVFVSRGPGFDAPGMRLDGGTRATSRRSATNSMYWHISSAFMPISATDRGHLKICQRAR
jgi:hypothetical protein